MKVHTAVPTRHRSLFPARPRTHHLSALVARTVGVVLLTPLILLAGLVALIALTAVVTSRNTGLGHVGRRPASAVAPLLRLETMSPEPSLGVARHAA